MSGQSDTMPMFLQFLSEGDKRLNIASTPNDLNNNVELDLASNKLGIGWGGDGVSSSSSGQGIKPSTVLHASESRSTSMRPSSISR